MLTLFQFNQPTFKWIASALLVGIALACLLEGWLPPAVAGLFCLFIVALAGYRLTASRPAWVRIALWLPLLPLGLAIALVRPEGFAYPLVFHLDALYPGGKPFYLHVNIAKALAGYAVIVWLLSDHSHPEQAKPKVAAVCVVLLAVLVLAVAVPLLGLQWQPKFGAHTVWFALVNLLVTCVAEESFMRLLVQAPLQRTLARLGRIPAAVVALAAASALFAAAHSPVGAEAWGIYLLAGVAYGAAFVFTGRLSAAIGTHFLVNITHYVLLTYPL